MFYDIFEEVCKKNNTTPLAVRKELGISQSTMASWKSRKLTPKYSTLKMIADYFNMNWTDLVPEEEQAQTVVDHITSKLRGGVIDNGSGLPVESSSKSRINAAASVDHMEEKLTPPQSPPKTEEEENSEAIFKELAQVAGIWSQIAEGLKRIKQDSPEEFERVGISLAEVDDDIANAEDWAASIASILILSGFTEEGAKKVIDYAADIMPRYKRPKPPPEDE